MYVARDYPQVGKLDTTFADAHRKQEGALICFTDRHGL
jgi:hypothetical protein